MQKKKQTLKRALCITLSAAMALTGGSFMPPGITTVVKAAEEAAEAENPNLIDNPSFEDSGSNDDGSLNMFWWNKESSTLTHEESGRNGKCVKVTRTGEGTSGEFALTQTLTDTNKGKLENNTEYEFSFWVKLGSDNNSNVTVKADLATEKTDGSYSGSDGWNLNSTEVTASGEWQEVKGSFTTNIGEGTNFKNLLFKVVGTGTGSFYVDDVSITKKSMGTNTPGQPDGTNLIDNPSFEDSGSNDDGSLNMFWWNKESSTLTHEESGRNGKCVKVTRTGEGTSGEFALTQTLTDTNKGKLENNTEYEFSFWVKLGSDNNSNVTVKADLATEKTDGSYSGSDGWNLNSTEVTASGEWQEVKGSFTTNIGEGTNFKNLLFKIIGTGTGSFYVDDVSLIKKGTGTNIPEEPVKPEKGENILDNPSFNGDTTGWFATGGEIEYVSDDGQDDIGGCAKLVGKTANWNSLAQQIKDKLKNKTKYNFSCWVKLGEEYTAESTVKAGLTIQSTEDNGGKPDYDKWGIVNNTVMASKNEWKEIKGSFVTSWKGELKDVQFKVADETVDTVNSFYVDNLSITEDDADLSIEEDIVSLKDFFIGKNPSYDFKVGGVVTKDIVNGDENKMKLVQKHYNSITANNEMKPDAIFKGLNADGSLILDFTESDNMLDYFKNYNEGKAEKDQIHIRGHVLCWYSQTPEKFFQHTDGSLLTKEEMNARLEDYIKQVVGHVQEKYPGLLYCWDVVNEAIIPGDGVKGGLRRYFNGGKEETGYYKIYGDSNEYIINAFKYADKYVDKDVKLFYNDYGETDPVKVQCICDLADAVIEGGCRIDGIGIQSHHSMEAPSAEELYNAIMAYGKHTKEVQITELDMLASKSYDGSDAQKEAELVKQAYRYKEFIDAILKAKDDGTNITALVFWGVSDSDSWLVTDEFSDGRHNMPLLFDENNKAKLAFYAITDPSKLPPYINEENVVESADKDWTLAAPVKIGNNSSMKFLWSNEKLYVQVTVKDATSDEGDSVTIYVDKDNVKADNANGIEAVTIKRSEAKATADGYVAEKEIAIPGKAANSKIGADAVVYDAATGTKECWNDTQMTQAEKSKYYGTLTLKPFMVIKKGSAAIDGEIDSAWNGIAAHKLTVSSNKSVSTTGTVKSMWDEDYLYVLAEVKDALLNKDSANAYEQDSLEIFVDENNGKTGSYEDDDCQYRINYENELSFNGKNCNASNIQSATKKTADGYIVEARIKFNTVKGAENNRIGIDFQINDADASGTRVASINWYDASGMGYAQPAVFGTAKLAAADKLPTEKPAATNPPSSGNQYIPGPGGSSPGGSTPGTGSTGAPGASSAPGTSNTGAPGTGSAPGTSNTGAPAASSTPGTGSTGAPAASSTPGTGSTGAPGVTTEIKTDETTGAVTEITTKVDNNKTTVTEKVTMPDGTGSTKETVTEDNGSSTVVTETLTNTGTFSVLVTKVTSDADGTKVSASASVYTGASDISSQYSAKTIIPEDYLKSVKDAGIDSVDIYVEKVTVDIAKDKLSPKILVKIEVPSVDGVGIGKVEVTKESIDVARESGKKLVVKVQGETPQDSYTVTIPQSELKKMDSNINVLVKTGKVSGMGSSSGKVNKILTSNKAGENNSYTVTIAPNNTKGGIKVTTPVMLPSAKTGDKVYAYRYNEKTGKLEEIPKGQTSVIKKGEAAIEGFSGNTYVITDKELSGKNVVTLLSKTKVKAGKTSLKKGGKTKIKAGLGTGLVLKPSVKSSAPYGKQAAVVTYKSSAPKKVKVSKDGTITAKGKGKAKITVKIKLAGGKVKSVKKTIVVK